VCAYASMASALHYSGDTITAIALKEYVDKGDGNISSEQDLNNFKLALISSRMYNTMTEHKRMKMADIKRGVVISALLVGSDGSSNHRVAIYNDWIFDSNCDWAFPLTQDNLNWCVDGYLSGVTCTGIKDTYNLENVMKSGGRRKRRHNNKKKKKRMKRI